MSSHHFHAVVWIDHREGPHIPFQPGGRRKTHHSSGPPDQTIHHKANSIGSGHAAEDHDYLQAVSDAIADAGAVLITGPANAKTGLVKHIHQHAPQ